MADALLDIICQRISDTHFHLGAAEQQFKDALKIARMALADLSKCEVASKEAGVDAPQKPDIAPTNHRREHRAGRVSK